MNCCFYSTPQNITSWLDMVDLAAEFGMDKLELFTRLDFAEPDPEFAKKFRAYADEKGVSICCLSTSQDLTGPDAEKNIARVKAFAEIAAILGCPYLHHTVCPEYRDKEKVDTRKDELFAKGIAAIREIYDHAQTFGIRTIYEDQGFLFNGLEGFNRLLKEVERPVGIVADFGNIRQLDEEILPLLQACFPQIAHVHLKDSVILPAQPEDSGYGYPTRDGKWVQEVEPGTGTVPLTEGIALLKELGYRGAYSIEFATTDPTLRQKVVERIAAWTE